ncbi:hypothetical protein [Mycoplasmopsis felis]|uniref:hypothetical protein n=1 Tax=Mycoplasmopsis felis TaxID=33923 RepID=UPI002AFEDBC5|nr:hypothetical protein [Mycoplasmopsis felis]WQQ06634.1 hypothetical protein RRG37_02150 [Mycoplasmopsis felis]
MIKKSLKKSTQKDKKEHEIITLLKQELKELNPDAEFNSAISQITLESLNVQIEKYQHLQKIQNDWINEVRPKQLIFYKDKIKFWNEQVKELKEQLKKENKILKKQLAEFDNEIPMDDSIKYSSFRHWTDKTARLILTIEKDLKEAENKMLIIQSANAFFSSDDKGVLIDRAPEFYKIFRDIQLSIESTFQVSIKKEKLKQILETYKEEDEDELF